MTSRDQFSYAKSASGLQIKSKSIRKQLLIFTWNMQGLVTHTGKLKVIEKEIEHNNLSVLGKPETHWTGDGFFRSESSNTEYK